MDDAPSWLAIEQSMTKFSLPALLFSGTKPLRVIVNNNFVLGNSLRIWYQIRKVYRLPETSAFTPICHNHAFLPSQLDAAFSAWKTKGLITIKDLYIENQFATFSQLRERYNLPSSHFFRYLQIRNYVRQNIPPV